MLSDVCVNLREHEQTKTGRNDGTLYQSEHPALAEFVTEEYETPQWWDIITNAKAAILDGTDIEPIVWVIDNFRLKNCMDDKIKNLEERHKK